MQLYAFDHSRSLIFADRAIKQRDYFCCECQNVVRVRKGAHRHAHFYHLQTSPACRLNGKGMVHIQLQLYLQRLLPKHESKVEYRFPSIQRIADVAWLPKKIVFEIQCSPISAEEVRERSDDYLKLDWQVVWVLHDSRFNKEKMCAAEIVLQGESHYFSNMNQNGEGVIYDQLSNTRLNRRFNRSSSFNVDLSRPKSVPVLEGDFPGLLKKWMGKRSCYFQGDCLDLFLEEPQKLNLMVDEHKVNSSSWLGHLIYRYMIRPYRLLFQMLLEKQCK